MLSSGIYFPSGNFCKHMKILDVFICFLLLSLYCSDVNLMLVRTSKRTYYFSTDTGIFLLIQKILQQQGNTCVNYQQKPDKISLEKCVVLIILIQQRVWVGRFEYPTNNKESKHKVGVTGNEFRWPLPLHRCLFLVNRKLNLMRLDRWLTCSFRGPRSSCQNKHAGSEASVI